MIWTKKQANMGLNLGFFGKNWAILALRIPMNFLRDFDVPTFLL